MTSRGWPSDPSHPPSVKERVKRNSITHSSPNRTEHSHSHPIYHNMNTSTHARSSVHPRDKGFRGFGAYVGCRHGLPGLMTWIGAGMSTHSPNKNTRQRAEDDGRALIQEWRQKERDINAVLISVSGHIRRIYCGPGRVDDRYLLPLCRPLGSLSASPGIS